MHTRRLAGREGLPHSSGMNYHLEINKYTKRTAN